MEPFDRKKHWESIFATRPLQEASWYEPTPATSLGFLTACNVPFTARIMDIGGGDSLLVDHLLDRGYRDITVLDISESALERAKRRLGRRARSVKWIVADVTLFQPTEHYDFWHDRAAFHFLTDTREISAYMDTAQHCIPPGGLLVIGTFSKEGPATCSGLPVRQYSENTLSAQVSSHFEKVRCIPVEHRTPADIKQQFIFCAFKRSDPTIQ